MKLGEDYKLPAGISFLFVMPVTCTLPCRGWNMLGWLRQEAYTGQAHYATENGEAGSAADDVREHWVRRQVRHHLTPSLATVSQWILSMCSLSASPALAFACNPAQS